MLLRSPLLLALSALSLASADDSPASTEGESDVICHPGTACYPREFVPSTTFRPVHEDQTIPKGLHVRINLETGEKEAKLVSPDSEDNDNDDEAVVIYDKDPATAAEHAAEYSPPAAEPPVDNSVKPPKNAAGEAEIFEHNVAVMMDATPASSSSSNEELAPALAALEEIAHEIYWGAEICKPRPVAALLNLISFAHDASTRASAALVLGAALSNNPKALANAGAGALVRPLLGALGTESDAGARRRVLFALTQTVKDQVGREAFVRADGVEELLKVFTAGDAEAQGKVAVLVDDAFLEMDMRVEKEAEMVVQGGGAGDAWRQLNAGVGRQFCAPFQKALTGGMREEDAAATEKVFAALAKLRQREVCEVEDGMREWVKSVQAGNADEEEWLREMVGESKELFL